jgi:molybdate transport system substrate-binding protein
VSGPARGPGRGGRALVAALATAGLVWAAPGAGAAELTLSVAISMKEAIEAIGRAFAARQPGVILRYNLGASGELQKQIEAGVPVDVFVSAATRQMDELETQGLVLGDTRRAFARNALVVVTAADSPLALARASDLLHPRVGHVAVGTPSTVPAGQYARESLRHDGLWERLGPRLVLGENVRQVLEYVARGEVEAGIVYATDAAIAGPRVRVRLRLAEDTHAPIIYPVAVVAGSRQPGLARAFVSLLTGPEGQAALRRLGFLPAPPGAR